MKCEYCRCDCIDDYSGLCVGCREEVESTRRHLDSALARLAEVEAEAEREREQYEKTIEGLRKAQTCVSCGSLICPPMQCGRCIETERPVIGMPERPVTANLKSRLAEVEAERDRWRTLLADLVRRLETASCACPLSAEFESARKALEEVPR